MIQSKNMTKEEIQNLFSQRPDECEYSRDWCRYRNPEEEDTTLREQSKEFRQFWHEKILDDNYSELSESDMNRVILFFDNTALGSREFRERGGVSCAKANIHKTLWYKALRDLKDKQDIRKVVNQILTEEDDGVITDLLNKLENINRGNGLTSAGTIPLSAILFTYNPDKYLSMLRFSDRLALIDFFGLGDSNGYRTYGEKIIGTNRDIINSFKEKFGVDTTPYRLTFFVYCQLDGKYNWKNSVKSGITNPSRRRFASEISDGLNFSLQRNKMSESVRNAVWRRDRGQCTECGSRENLEYDHIIPVSKGGGNTVRNLELLCESCNRKKSDKI